MFVIIPNEIFPFISLCYNNLQVRGVGAGGIVSSAYCLLYKLYTLKLTRKQLMGLITHKDSPYIRGLGFMYIRSVLNIHVTVFKNLHHSYWCLKTGINLGVYFENILNEIYHYYFERGGGKNIGSLSFFWGGGTHDYWSENCHALISFKYQMNITHIMNFVSLLIIVDWLYLML